MMGFETPGGAVFWLIGSIMALLLFLAPMITFKKIIASKSTQEFSGIPYVVTLLHCLVTGWSSAIVLTDFIEFLVNMAGAGIELIYVIIFLVFAQKREKGKIFGILILVLSLFGAIALLSVYLFDGEGGGRILCRVAYIMSSIVMYASPLSIMRDVIRTKSTEFMPFFLSLFVFLYAISWFIFGLLQRDPFMAVPAGLGCVLGVIQLVLYACNRNNPAEKYSKFGKGSLDIGVSQLPSNLEQSPSRPV